MNISIAFSSYQSSFLYMLGRLPDGGAPLHQCAMLRPMGIYSDVANRISLSAGSQLLRLANVLAPRERINGTFDACFVPRVVHSTGNLDAHDVGLGAYGQPIFVNTRYNCLVTTDAMHSFREIWRPEFVTTTVVI